MKRFLIPAVLAAALTACGGGGGGGGPMPSTGGGGGGQTQSAVQSVPVQRSLADQTLQSTDATLVAFGQTSGGTLPFRIKRSTIDAAARRAVQAYRSGAARTGAAARAAGVQWGACTNSTESATVNVSATETQLYERTFYDAACTKLQDDVYLDLVATSSSAASITGNATAYDANETVTSYATITMSLTGVGSSTGTFSIEMTNAANATSPVIADAGVACSISTGSIGCGIGSVDHDAAANDDLGLAMTFTVAASSAQSGLTNVSVSGNIAGYTGSLDALKLAAGTFPAWTVSGGTTLDSASVSGTIAFNSSGLPASGSLSLTDETDHGSAMFSASATGGTGTITDTATGTTVATFTVDHNGNGTITFGNGTTAPIAAWQVLG